MGNRFVVNFKSASRQDLDKGSVVTYVNELRLNTIKEHLLLDTDFYVVQEIDEPNVYITNGVDTITSTTDQLIKVVPYLEEIPEVSKPVPGGDPSRYLRDLIRWNESEELRRTYVIKDNFLSIMAAGLVITDRDFIIETSAGVNEYGKKLNFVTLIPDRISSYIYDK
jgi:hypothetical protein